MRDIESFPKARRMSPVGVIETKNEIPSIIGLATLVVGWFTLVYLASWAEKADVAQ